MSQGYLQGGKTVTQSGGTVLIPADTDVVILDTTGGASVATLPDAADHEGRYITVIKTGDAAATVDTSAGQYIESNPSIELVDRS